MNKKSVLGLILFSCVVIASMFLGTMIMIRQGSQLDYNQNQEEATREEIHLDQTDKDNPDNKPTGLANEEKLLGADSSDVDTVSDTEELAFNDLDTTKEPSPQPTEPPSDELPANQDGSPEDDIDENESEDGVDDSVTDSFNANPDDLSDDNQEDSQTEDALSDNLVRLPDMQLIYNCNDVDYMKYVPEMIYDSKIEVALDITNPDIDIEARSAILFDLETRRVLYYKDPIVAVFPASTAKLLTALVTLDLCMEEEEVVVGDELDLVASDSTLAGLRKGQVLSIRNLIEGMLVPSGNDAAYVIAAYVGRKSLNDDNAGLDLALPEFIRLMNKKAQSLGTINSCFKTPDGYDAIGQYTTAYDMGMIGMAAAENETIRQVCNKTSARNIFVDGKDVTWYTTNSLIKKNSGNYYSNCIGLKTGTSEMSGRCLISLGKKDGREVISVIMDSNSSGRWSDSIKLLNYGLGL
ncbi:MAG: hypothetical protein GX237_01780 [Clostridiales bacterium]|nr:hypothetical protein [Clostridiales bacterium]